MNLFEKTFKIRFNVSYLYCLLSSPRTLSSVKLMILGANSRQQANLVIDIFNLLFSLSLSLALASKLHIHVGILLE